MILKSDHFTKTGSGQTRGKLKKTRVFLQAELTEQLTTLRQRAMLDLAHASAGEKAAAAGAGFAPKMDLFQAALAPRMDLMRFPEPVLAK